MNAYNPAIKIGQTGQKSLSIPYFPISGLLSWFGFNKIQDAQHKHTLIKNWRIDLQTAPSPITDFTAAFQAFLHTFLSEWHDPKKSHRHFVSTETLLAISESLYAIAQATENQALNTVYERLEQLHNSPTVRKTAALQQEKAVLEETLCDIWQRLTFLPPKDLADLEPLQSLSAWQRLRHWRTLKQLRQATQRYQQIPEHCEAVKTYYHWERGVKRCETALFAWLRDAIFKQLDFPNGLDALPDILLGILLVHSTEPRPIEPEARIETWLQQHPPWQNGESLQRALDGSGWQTWAQGDKPPLYTWLDLLGQKPRLSINQETTYFEQPDLQKELRQLMAGQPDKLISQLQHAWEDAQQRAFLLAQLLTRLNKPDFEGYLLALTEKLVFDIGPESRSLQEVFSALASPKQQAALFQHHDIVEIFEQGLIVVGVTLPTYFKALAAVILGDAPEQIDNALHNWLAKQGEWDDSLPIEETLAVLKHRFNRAIAIYQPKHPELGNTVHDWAQVLLREVLSSETPALEQIWAQLERARIALTGLSFTLPAQWDETLGRALWAGLRTTMDQIGGGYVPSENEPWQPIDIWNYQISEWTSNRPPTSETAQQHLHAQEALAQPFLDPVQQRYRVLWLDQNGLSLKDLPDDCALEQHWTEKTGVIGQWTEGLNQRRKRRRTTSDSSPDWEKVMSSDPVQSWATRFQDWAAELTQLTVIFPAPLGQLPWETLPELEEKLVREISLAHWLKARSSEKQASESVAHFVTSDPNGEAQCMVKEGRWVAKHFKTRLAAPCLSVFDAIQQLSHCQQAHFCTHGAFKRDNPLASGLILLSKRDKNDKKDKTLKIRFPLWTTSLLPISAEVIVLSACESNLSGQATEGLLTPIGIGPSLAGAGAKTVIGTLWPCDGVAALCFGYHLYNIVKEEPQLPWHQVVAKARHQLQAMSLQDLKQIESEYQLEAPDDACSDALESVQAKARFGQKPFKSFSSWAGFVVLGEVNRL
ncbi:MAG: hypothetical protein DRR16_27655 [Candidatus Parabeggiatoa sp. nov. 3]|nr:MAG: hypothetical protein DRR00_09835 [Gammaproteobacteria bacterium]RKZ67475.1 MAG: hypothetical protein DRQ99_06660 [Gammaproteobacteria bacterium]RKZ78453.1 MAG: hypothetical protein DRR16_27655 [Gammaproteobacteria bacterium]HEW97525.1 CHAT domain-containing protein [Beggiatoa sp.]